MRAGKHKNPITLSDFARMGGMARAASMSKEQRSAAASKAAKARWKSKCKRKKSDGKK
jgi:hypothetical protein